MGVDQRGFAAVNGLHLYYEIHGSGAPLVLIHGGGSTIESNWSRLIPLLARRRRVIAVEEQGHGHTGTADRPFSFEATADDVAALLDHLRVESADVMGFSNGGMSALRLAIRHPRKARKLILASTPCRKDGMVPGFWEGLARGTLADMPKALQEADLKINGDPRHLQAMFELDSRRMLGPWHFSDEELRAVQAPALVLAGDRDVITTDHALALGRLLADSRLCIVPGNHGSYLGEAASWDGSSRTVEAVAGLIEDFLG